jgi:hypothetical protein
VGYQRECKRIRVTMKGIKPGLREPPFPLFEAEDVFDYS